jgi:hypothetical protein
MEKCAVVRRPPWWKGRPRRTDSPVAPISTLEKRSALALHNFFPGREEVTTTDQPLSGASEGRYFAPVRGSDRKVVAFPRGGISRAHAFSGTAREAEGAVIAYPR